MTRTIRTLTSLFAFLTITAAAGAAFAAGAQAGGAADEQATVERLRAETELARAEAERARAEAERLRAAAAASHVVVVEEDLPDPGAYRRDGFFLRMALGGGYAGYRSDGTLTGTGARDLDQDGPGGLGLLSIGGVVAPDLALHADFWGVAGPLEEVGGVDIEVSNGTVGMGVTKYWMPWNVYLTGAVGVSVTTWHTHDEAQNDHDDYSGAVGLGTYLMVGKEWWVSENWSLGIALRGDYAFTTSDDVEFHHAGGQALFTATFN